MQVLICEYQNWERDAIAQNKEPEFIANSGSYFFMVFVRQSGGAFWFWFLTDLPAIIPLVLLASTRVSTHPI